MLAVDGCWLVGDEQPDNFCLFAGSATTWSSEPAIGQESERARDTSGGGGGGGDAGQKNSIGLVC